MPFWRGNRSFRNIKTLSRMNFSPVCKTRIIFADVSRQPYTNVIILRVWVWREGIFRDGVSFR